MRQEIFFIMNGFYLCIVAFLIVLAVFDLIVGVSNDAVNFLNSAIGAKVARFRTIVAVAAVGVFAGASMSNGMMDVARHGIMMPAFYSFSDVMCVFLAVMATDVILLNIFNTLGMPTSTTVSMVFELLGGAFAVALVYIIKGATDAEGMPLSLGDLLNTEKALSVIVGIFLSVAIAFVFGAIVQWLARIVFTFTYRVNGTTTSIDTLRSAGKHDMLSSSLKIGIFAGIATTSIIWFLLINGLKNANFMTQELKTLINENTWLILGSGCAFFSFVMTVLSALKLPVLKLVVLLGTFALAMAFAGNDLVNFVGVPLTGLDAYMDYSAHGNGDPHSFMMQSLMGSAQTPVLFLVIAGLIMVLSLIFSKKAQNVVKTSVDLSRQDEGDEMFGSSALARVLVRHVQHLSDNVSRYIPRPVKEWVDSRFNAEAAVLPEGAAFDQIRASINLVLAGLLVAFGTSMKLPLSTTYVTFMVAMGTSLADRAWSRESAVFRITGVLSVIGGWFITAGVAFIICFLITNLLVFSSKIAVLFVVIVVAIVALVIGLLLKRGKPAPEDTPTDKLFKQLLAVKDKSVCWTILKQYVSLAAADNVHFASQTYKAVSDAFLQENYRVLRLTTHHIETAHKQLKRQRRREIICLRKIDPLLAIQKNTWYFHVSNNTEQMLYCIKRINDACIEHVGNNFPSLPSSLSEHFGRYQQAFLVVMEETERLLSRQPLTYEDAAALRAKIEHEQHVFEQYQKQIIQLIQHHDTNIPAATVYLSLIQESQLLMSNLRHILRGMAKFTS